jgi:protein-tyrosine phosphatase
VSAPTDEAEAIDDEGHIAVDGCVNFRDAGGWSTIDGATMRRNRLYRSDDPVRVTDRGRRSVAALGFAAVVDLRQEQQFLRAPGFVDSAITFHRPLVDRVIDVDDPPPLTDPEHITDVYDSMIARSRGQIGEVLGIIGDHVGSGPVLVHCAFGKDRTGIVVALVQAAIGVPMESIADEYHRSHEPSRRRREWMISEPLPDDPPIHRPPAYLFSAPRQSMELLLEHAVETHGTLTAWFDSFPTPRGTTERLREGLLVQE